MGSEGPPPLLVCCCGLCVGEECPVAFLRVCEPLEVEARISVCVCVCLACTRVGVNGVFPGLDVCRVVCLVTLKDVNGADSCKM